MLVQVFECFFGGFRSDVLTPSCNFDTVGAQLDEVRKEVARLKQAVEAKDRESVQSLSMYDKMKTVSRKIKEVSGYKISKPSPLILSPL